MRKTNTSLLTPLLLFYAVIIIVEEVVIVDVVDAFQCGWQAGGMSCYGNNCCSQYGWCGSTAAHCGTGCQSGPCGGTGYNFNYCGANWIVANSQCGQSCPGGTDAECTGGGRCYADCTACPAVPVAPSPSPPPPIPPTTTNAVSLTGDSRLIAYVGNWQPCPSPTQTDAYTHIVVAFAVTYTWSRDKNICNTECALAPSVTVCGNGINQQLVNEWRAQGKRVLLSFGGAGMGGSWLSDNNNCWDYCFGKEEELSTALVDIMQNQGFDGIDIDYEYCYDKDNSRHSGCYQTTELYTDTKAQTFLATLTELLRQKLDALGGQHYELTHAPMDVDLLTDSPYYLILQSLSSNLDFLMPQFYNGITRPIEDGFANSDAGDSSAATVYGNIANDMFDGEPEKVVFGFCISDCSGTGSNSNGDQAATVLSDIKTYNNNEFVCNGGAFFWVADADSGGSWSDPVWEEVEKTAGCSLTSSPTQSPTPRATDPTEPPTSAPTTSPTTSAPTTSPSEPQPTDEPITPPPAPLPDPNSTCGTGCPSSMSPENLFPTADCVGFYMCWNGITYSWICPAGTLFDANFQLCNHSYLVNCQCTTNVPPSGPAIPSPTPPPTSPATPPPAGSSPSGPCASSTCPTASYGMVGGEDCLGFYHCSFGVKGSFVACPPMTLWQESFKGCDWDYRVQCACNGNPPTSPPQPTPNPPTSQSSGRWYPEWERSDTCQDDGEIPAPGWMAYTYFSTTKSACCSEWYWWRTTC